MPIQTTSFLDNKKRIESGALQIGDDYPGLFLRGDESFMFSSILEKVIKGESINTIEEGYLKGILKVINDDVILK